MRLNEQFKPGFWQNMFVLDKFTGKYEVIFPFSLALTVWLYTDVFYGYA